jgi:uncharacterized protein YggU (UPF0235/DUF167 family)
LRSGPGLLILVIGGIVLATAAISVAAIWAVIPGEKATANAAETPAATTVSETPANVDPATRLKEAEGKLASLSETYARERKRVIGEAFDKMVPDEFRELMADMDKGQSMEVATDNETRRNEASDRGLSPQHRLASINARTERKRRFLESMQQFQRDLENPKSVLWLGLQAKLEALDSTKELRKQERLVADLRRNVPAAKMLPDPKTADAAEPPTGPSADPAQPAADGASQLRAAEQKLAALKEKSARDLNNFTYAHLLKACPEEFRQVVKAISQGTPPRVAWLEDDKRFEAEIRGLPPDEREARIKDRDEKSKRNIELTEEFARQLEDPNSAVALEFEALESTKELRAQQRLVERLRRELQSATTSGG